MNINNKSLLNNLNCLCIINSCLNHNSLVIPTIDKLFLGFKIDGAEFNETSVVFPKTLWLLEHMVSQKVVVKTLKTMRVGRNERRIFFSAQVVLRGLKLCN